LVEIGATIVTFAVAVTTDGPPVADAVAMMVTTGLGGLTTGTVGGAVKVAVAPLAVWAGETEPQGELAQLTTQSTPAFVVSFKTVATTGAGALVSIVLGGTCVRLMRSGSVTRNEADALKL
jgi:hypothetical protein